MLTRVYMKWVPLLVVSGGNGIVFHVLQGLSLSFLSLLLLSNRQDKLQVLQWRLGHGSAKAAFETFASALLAGI